jgi:hypothetical protein
MAFSQRKQEFQKNLLCHILSEGCGKALSGEEAVDLIAMRNKKLPHTLGERRLGAPGRFGHGFDSSQVAQKAISLAY